MIALTSGLSYFDLNFRGTPRVIATAVLHGAAGIALVDPGPSSTLPALQAGLDQAGIRLHDVAALLLTHIHLDHAGVAGTLVRAHPRLRVFVHEKGAPHVINPERLLQSAARLYGDAMEELWGEVAPVPAGSVTILKGGERVTEGGRTLEVEYTPGHASHHVSYFDRESGIALAGDAAGIKLTPTGVVLPPTPPPDIDLEAWRDSIRRIDAWHADTLFVTHFGPAPAAGHLEALEDHIELSGRLVRESLVREGSDQERERWFADQIRLELRRRMSGADAEAYELAGRFDLNWRGLARYWRKKGGA
jgi:glyoxylase-like metal-dependent hydrolase (beta-lactamase superfamily II)